MNLRFQIISFVAAAFLLWGVGASTMHAHEAHDAPEATPCEICLIVTAGEDQGAAIALPATEFAIYIASRDQHDFARLASSEIVITPVRGPPKRGPPSRF